MSDNNVVDLSQYKDQAAEAIEATPEAEATPDFMVVNSRSLFAQNYEATFTDVFVTMYQGGTPIRLPLEDAVQIGRFAQAVIEQRAGDE